MDDVVFKVTPMGLDVYAVSDKAKAYLKKHYEKNPDGSYPFCEAVIGIVRTELEEQEFSIRYEE